MRVVVTRTFKKIVQMKYCNDELHIVANYFVSRNKIKQMIADNAEWINACKERSRKYNDVMAKQDRAEETKRIEKENYSFDNNEVIRDIFLGKKTLILGEVVDVLQSMTSKTYLDGNSLYLSDKIYQDKNSRIKAIKSYLKKMASLYVASEIAAFGSGVSLCPAKIEFKDIADSWMKCSLASQKILCIDYRITQLPQNLRTYVIAHAFAHFLNPVHDENFWNGMSNLLPRYEDYKKQLESYDFLKDV